MCINIPVPMECGSADIEMTSEWQSEVMAYVACSNWQDPGYVANVCTDRTILFCIRLHEDGKIGRCTLIVAKQHYPGTSNYPKKTFLVPNARLARAFGPRTIIFGYLGY